MPKEAYTGERTVAFTACLRTREPFFVSTAIVAQFVEKLQLGCEKGTCFAPIYCFMPDHLHVMLKGLSETSDMLLAMRQFKLTSGILMPKLGAARWQPRH